MGKKSNAEFLESQIRNDPRMVRMYGTPEMQPRSTAGIRNELNKSKNRKLVFLYVVLIIIGLLGLAFALLDDAGIMKFRETADEATVVVTMIRNASGHDDIYVTYEYDREMHYNVYAGKAQKDRFSTGDEITVFISRRQPEVLMMDFLGRFIWLRNISLAVIGTGILLIAIHVFRKHLQKSAV